MPTRFGIRPAALYIVFLLLSTVIFSTSFDNSFRDDDFVFMRHAAGAAGVSDLLKPSPHFAFYRPGALLLFWVQVKTLGANGGGYLVFNFVVHVLNSILLVLVLRRLSFAPGASFLAGGLFVMGFAHYGKQVMWACSGGPLVSVLLIMCAVYLCLRKAGGPALVGVIAAAALAPAFHEIGLAAPVLVAAAQRLGGGRESRFGGSGAGEPTLSRLVLVILGAVFVGWLAVYAAVSNSYESYGRAAAMFSDAPGLFVRFLGFMVTPIQQSDIASQHASLFGLALRLSRGVQLFMGITVLAASLYVLVTAARPLKFTVIWLYLALIPFCFIRLPEGWLELRYLYFAAMPFCALFAALMIEALARHGTMMKIAVAAVLIMASGLTSYVVRSLENRYDARAKDPVSTERMDDVLRDFPGLRR